MQKQHEETLLHNQSLMKSVSKSKEVVDELRTCLKSTCTEVHTTKSKLLKTHNKCNAAKNESLSMKYEHHAQTTAMEQDAEETLEREKRGHKIVTAKIVSKSESEFAAAERKHKRKQGKILSKSESELAAAEIDYKRKQAKILSKSESELAAAERKNKRKERKLTQKNGGDRDRTQVTVII